MQNPSKIIACLLFTCLFFLSAGLRVHAVGPIYDLGVFAFEENDYVNAESYFKKALETDPQDARAAQFLGKTYIKLERYEEALVYLNSADEKDPELPGLKFDRAYVYFRLEDYGRASALFRSIAEEAPSDASASYHAGVALYKLGQYKEAPAYLIQAAEKSPTVKDLGYFYAGICYHKTGQTTDALKRFTYLKTSGQSVEIRDAAAKWIAEIEKKDKDSKPFGLFLKTGVQYDSNVNLAPIDEDKISEEDDIVSLLFFSAKYDAIDKGAFLLGAGYSQYQSFHADLSAYDMTGLVGSLYGKYRFHPFVAGLTYYPAYYRLDNEGFLMRHHIRSELICEAGDSVLLRLALDHFINNHLEDDGRSGSADAMEIELLYGLAGNKGHVFALAGVEGNHASHPDYDYELFKAKLGVSLNLPGEITFSASGQASDKDYDSIDTTFKIKRNDTQYKGAVMISRPLIYDWLVVSGEFELIRNDSDIVDFEYRESLATLSLSVIY